MWRRDFRINPTNSRTHICKLHLKIYAELEKSEKIRQAKKKPKRDDADAAIASRSLDETQTLFILYFILLLNHFVFKRLSCSNVKLNDVILTFTQFENL